MASISARRDAQRAKLQAKIDAHLQAAEKAPTREGFRRHIAAATILKARLRNT